LFDGKTADIIIDPRLVRRLLRVPIVNYYNSLDKRNFQHPLIPAEVPGVYLRQKVARVAAFLLFILASVDIVHEESDVQHKGSRY
jgi:hypothetical protein